MAANLVLIVDDDRAWAQTAAGALADVGYRVQIAYDGNQGLAQFGTGHPDLMILDVDLPKMGGIGVLQTVRQSDALTPIVMATGNSAGGVEARARSAGATEFLHKPIALRLFRETVRRLVIQPGPRTAGR